MSDALCKMPRVSKIGEDDLRDASHKVVKTVVFSPHIYKPVGPYSQAILADKTLYLSGVLGLDVDGAMVVGGIEAQTRQVLDNMKRVLEAGGASLESVIKTTVLLSDMQDFQTFNKVYAEYFPEQPPARATYQVAKLPLGAAIEIECIALSGELTLARVAPCPCVIADRSKTEKPELPPPLPTPI